ncbi:MAG TPA: hypothetical protein VEB68_05510 [Croceibacterium sp.]|nr:hypothetical protein [Croceibacterium sp.]
MLATAVVGLLRPSFNWDMIPYVALVEDGAAGDRAERHARAYRLVQAAAPARHWARMTESNAYRARQYAEARAFDSQLGMYRIKLGYVPLGGRWRR